jgi:hypothetical protein
MGAGVFAESRGDSLVSADQITQMKQLQDSKKYLEEFPVDRYKVYRIPIKEVFILIHKMMSLSLA